MKVLQVELVRASAQNPRKLKKRNWKLSPGAWISAGLAISTVALFSPVLTHTFLIYDDQQYVTENPHVRAGLTWKSITWAFGTFYASNWHPLTWLSHMLDFELYGLHPWGHHLTSVLFHAANTVILFLFLKRTTGALWRSACVAALFGWHPLHVQSVAWVAERKDVLSSFFFLLTLLAYARYVSVSKVRDPQLKVCEPEVQLGGRTREGSIQEEGSRFRFHFSRLRGSATFWHASTLVCSALALMSKPMAVTLPFVLLLVDYWPLGRTLSRSLWRLTFEKVPFFVLSAAGCILTIAAQQQGYALVSMGGLPVQQRIEHALVSYMHYLAAMFLPRHLAVYYPYPSVTPTFEAVTAGLALVLISALFIFYGRRYRYVLVGWLWYLGMLVPVIGIVQVGDQAWADRYTYLPLIGVFWIVAWGLTDLCGRLARVMEARAKMVKALLPILAVVTGACLLVATRVELAYWKNSRALFARAAEVTERNARAVTMLGSLLAEQGKLEEAKALYAQALSYSPHDPEAHFSLGKALDKQGQLDQAIAEYSQVLWFRPLREQAHIYIGLCLAKQKRYDEAALQYRAALETDPNSAAAHNDLARVLHSQGRVDEAIEEYEQAIKDDPELAQAHNNLGVLLLEVGHLQEGELQLREAVQLNPKDSESQYNLGLALNQREKWQEANEIFSQAIGRGASPDFQYQFALALEHLGRAREAMSHYAKALLLRPDVPQALDRLAWILATNPDPRLRNGVESVKMAERACELTGSGQWRLLITLAAAYAEAGRFKEAAESARKAQALAESRGERAGVTKCKEVLDAVDSGRPWRGVEHITD